MDKPNVVVCLCDQLRAFEVGCYGNPVIRTPHMDRLAREGVRFDLAVTNNPVCVPARSNILSGQHSRTCTGNLGNCADDPPCMERVRLTDPTLPELFRTQGYKTALIGKWHVHPHPQIVGFDHALYPLIAHRHYGQTYFENQDDGFIVEEFGPDFEAARVRDYIRENRDNPFFLYYTISQPHAPIGPGNAPDKYVSMYDRDEVPLRQNVWQDGALPYDERWFQIYTIWDYFWRNHSLKTDKLPDGFDIRTLTAYYYGMVSCVDDMVGGLMDSLQEWGVADNTIVVFVSDHGDILGSHHVFNKGCLLEEALRIPLIFWCPKKLRPSVNTRQVAQLIDVMPTLLDVCGMSVPDHVQGRSLAPILSGERDALDEDFAFIETGGRAIGIRTPSHLYGMQLAEDERTVTDDRLCFYDLAKDPYQENNLAAGDDQSEVAEGLRRKLTEWNERTPWRRVEGPQAWVHPPYRTRYGASPTAS